jgi:acyl carrier protein
MKLPAATCRVQKRKLILPPHPTLSRQGGGNNTEALLQAAGNHQVEMTRDEIKTALFSLFRDRFEIDDPDPDANLREEYEFDSIDAIEMLREIELMLGTQLTRAEKKQAMEIRTINQILDYIISLSAGAAQEDEK